MGKDTWVDNTVVAVDENGNPNDCLRLYEYKERLQDVEETGDVIVKIEASSVSMMDCFLRRNLWHQQVSTPYRLGCDLVGRVVYTEPNNCGIEIGDRVCTIGLKVGGNSKYATVPCHKLIKCPTGIDGPVIACLLRTYMVAYQCLHRAGSFAIREGDKVLVTGGSGAIGQAVIQLAKVARAGDIYATGRGSKSQRTITALGAKFLGRKPSEWLPKVKGKMDIVIDSACSDSFNSSRLALKDIRSKLVCIGTTSKLRGGNGYFTGQPIATQLDILKAKMFMTQTTFFDLLSSFDENLEGYKDDLGRLFKLLRSKSINPKIAFCVPLEEIAYAHSSIESGDVCGTIVCQPFDFHKNRNKSKREQPTVITRDCTMKDESTTYTDGIVGEKAKDDKSLFSGYTTEVTDFNHDIRHGPSNSNSDLESDFNKHKYSYAKEKRKIKLLDDDETLNRSQAEIPATMDSMTFKSDVKFSDKTIADSIWLRKQQYCDSNMLGAGDDPSLPPSIFGSNKEASQTNAKFIIKKKEKTKSKGKGGIRSLLPMSPKAEDQKKVNTSPEKVSRQSRKDHHSDNSSGSFSRTPSFSKRTSSFSSRSKQPKSETSSKEKPLTRSRSKSKTRESRDPPQLSRKRSTSRSRTKNKHSAASSSSKSSGGTRESSYETRNERSEASSSRPRSRSKTRKSSRSRGERKKSRSKSRTRLSMPH